jgi:hypothetical protein
MGRYSIKPGRGPSAFGAVGGIIGAIFGVFWTILAIAMTSHAPSEPPFGIVKIIFPLFGVIFVIGSIAAAVYNAHNATGRNRFSNFDVVPSDSEPEPLGPGPSGATPRPGETAAKFCSHCGAPLRSGDRFCSRCGAGVA